ncbi:hypothetical protein EFJ52_25645, partial [Escherichia coli]|nr:hypothetical protein [Escherichia coli]
MNCILILEKNMKKAVLLRKFYRDGQKMHNKWLLSDAPALALQCAAKPSVRCTKHIIAHSQTIRSSLLLLFLSV